MLDRPLYQTAARREIASLLQAERRYLTASALLRKLKRSMPNLAKSTVYRTLEVLEAGGLVMSRTGADGETSYVYCHPEHHHHAICSSCGTVTDVDCTALDALKRRLLAEEGFEVDGHAVELSGRCAACRAKPVRRRRTTG